MMPLPKFFLSMERVEEILAEKRALEGQQEEVTEDNIPVGSKRCNVCNKIKPLSDFYKRRDGISGHSYRCKACDREYQRARRAKK